MLRFGACLGIEIPICDPHHPQQNAFVERFPRSEQEEGLALDRPATLEEARSVPEAFHKHSNFERPNQALWCGNHPPRSAFPILASLPALPRTVDPERWLQALDGLHLERKVDAHGMVSLDLKRYSISWQLVGQRVVFHLDAKPRCWQVLHEQHPLKSLPLKGLVGRHLPFDQFLAHMFHQARAHTR